MRTKLGWILLTALGLAAGCGTSASTARTLANPSPSPEALAARYLDALGRDDLESMKALRLTEQEFCAYVFPELPSSRLPNVKCDFVWSQATLNSMAGMQRMLESHRGKRYELVSVRFAAVDDYDTYRVHKEPLVTFRDETGATHQARLFGSMLELDGQYKLFSFVVD
jgi:hypothetical protein